MYRGVLESAGSRRREFKAAHLNAYEFLKPPLLALKWMAFSSVAFVTSFTVYETGKLALGYAPGSNRKISDLIEERESLDVKGVISEEADYQENSIFYKDLKVESKKLGKEVVESISR